VDSASWNPQQKQIQLLVNNTGKASARPSVNWTLKRGEMVIKTGNLDGNGVIAESDRNLLLNYPDKEETALVAGEYQLTGELVWVENTKKMQPFSVNLTIPAK
jgi:hypothetical protein